MKRIVVILLAIVCGVAFSDGFAKKPAKKKQKVEVQEKLDSLANEKMRHDSLRMAEELEALEEELRLEKERRSANQKGKPLEIEEEEILLPCQEEAQSNDEYFGAFGMSENEITANDAILRATLDAQMELAKIVGEDIDSNLIEMVCRQLAREHYGTWSAFVAIRIPKNKQ